MDQPEKMPARLAPGATLDGRYRIESEIGSGLTGVVYRATHLLMERTVAIKMLTHEKAGDFVSLERFQNEAKAVSLLDHPAIVKIHDFGFSQQGEPYLVMDLVNGTSLAKTVQSTGRLSAQEAIAVFRKIASALSHAHQKGVIHRDIKPTNIILLPDQAVMVVDFGIAKLANPESGKSPDLTQPGQTFADPVYMSPEQCLARRLDARSDIYSLGCVLYEAVTGKPPFNGTTVMETISQHLSAEAAPIDLDRSDKPLESSLAAVLKDMMQKNPEKRFASMQEVELALAKLTGSESEESAAITKAQSNQQPKRFSHLSYRLMLAALGLVLISAIAFWSGTPSGQLAIALAMLSVKETLLSSNDRALIDSKAGIAALYQQQGNPSAAAAMYERMLTDIRNLKGEQSIAVAEALEHLGDLYNQSGDSSRANQRYKEALKLRDKLYFKPNLSSHDRAYCITELKHQLAIAQKVGGQADPSNVQLEASIASLLQQDRQDEEAEKFYKLAIEHMESFEKSDQKKTWLICHDFLGRLYRDSGRLQEAETYLKKAIAGAIELFGVESHHTQTFVMDLVVTHQLGKRWQEQVRLLNSVLPALMIEEPSTLPFAVRTERQNDQAILQRYLGVAYGKLRKDLLAEKALKKAIELSSATGNLKDLVTEQCLLGHQFVMVGELQKAKQVYETAVAQFDRAGLPAAEQANMLDSYGQLLELLGEKTKADLVKLQVKRVRAT